MVKKTTLAKTSKVLRMICIAAWALVIAACVGSYLMYPQAFTATNIAAFLSTFEGGIWLIYLTLSVLRGFTLLPSTPLVIAGTLLFPMQPFAVLAISITGILLSSAMIYFFSDYLGFSDFFENHKPELNHRMKTKLEHPAGFAFVALWAFFPLVPTDLVCYVAGTTRMNFFKFIAAIFAGEIVLCVIYIFSGSYLLDRFV